MQGNLNGYVIFCGGKVLNYGLEDVVKCEKEMVQVGLKLLLMVDCSYGNFNKDFCCQLVVVEFVVVQIKDGNCFIIGLMIESNIYEGNQFFEQLCEVMKYGVLVMDVCISWEIIEVLLCELDKDFCGYLVVCLV